MSRIANLLVKITDKKKGVKLTDAVTYLKSKADEMELGEVTLQGCKELVATLFAEGKIDMVEYKLPGEDEKNKIFLLPVGCTVVHGEEDDTTISVDEDQVFAQLVEGEPEPVLMSHSMFTQYHIVGKDTFIATPEAEHAQALYMKALGDNQAPRIFGAVPISIDCSISYTPPKSVSLETVVPEPGAQETSAAATPTAEVIPTP